MARQKISKFYVGARHIAEAIGRGETDDWQRVSLDDAVRHARQIVESGEQECAIVVQIVRIVKRKEQPIVVEVVK